MTPSYDSFKNSIGYKYIEEKGLEFADDFGQTHYYWPRVFRVSQEEGTFVGPFNDRKGGISSGLMESLNIRSKFDFYKVFRFCTIVLTDFTGTDSSDSVFFHVERFKKWLEKNQETVSFKMYFMLGLYAEKIGNELRAERSDIDSFIRLACFVFKLDCPYGLKPK